MHKQEEELEMLARLLLVLGVTFLAPIQALSEESYPARTIQLIAIQAPGSTVDLVARLLARKFTERGYQMVVINRTGAEGEIGKRECANAVPDGYTLCLVGDGDSIVVPAAITVAKQPPLPELIPIGFVDDQFYLLVVRKDLPGDLEGFVAYVKAHPGALACGSGNIWGRLGIGMLNSIPGVNVRTIPYNTGGEPQIQLDLLAGRIDCAFSTLTTAHAAIESGDIRVLGTVGSMKNPFLPNVAPLAQWGYPEFSRFGSWHALFAPKGVSNGAIVLLNRELQAILAEPGFAEALRRYWTQVRPAVTPQQAKTSMEERFEETKVFLCRQKVRVMEYECVE